MAPLFFGAAFGILLGLFFCTLFKEKVTNTQIKISATTGAIIGALFIFTASPWITPGGPMLYHSTSYKLFPLNSSTSGIYLVLQQDGTYVADTSAEPGVQPVPEAYFSAYHLSVLEAPRDYAVAIVATTECARKITLWTICWRSTTEVVYKVPPETTLNLLDSR